MRINPGSACQPDQGRDAARGSSGWLADSRGVRSFRPEAAGAARVTLQIGNAAFASVREDATRQVRVVLQSIFWTGREVVSGVTGWRVFLFTLGCDGTACMAAT